MFKTIMDIISVNSGINTFINFYRGLKISFGIAKDVPFEIVQIRANMVLLARETFAGLAGNRPENGQEMIFVREVAVMAGYISVINRRVEED